jgi:hypothetical protein
LRAAHSSILNLGIPLSTALAIPPAYVSIRQHTSAYVNVCCSFVPHSPQPWPSRLHPVSIRQHSSAYVNVCCSFVPRSPPISACNLDLIQLGGAYAGGTYADVCIQLGGAPAASGSAYLRTYATHALKEAVGRACSLDLIDYCLGGLIHV